MNFKTSQDFIDMSYNGYTLDDYDISPTEISADWESYVELMQEVEIEDDYTITQRYNELDDE